MRKSVWSACVALLVFGMGNFESAGLAKPPDLPVDLGVDFEESASPSTLTLGYDFLGGKMLLSWAMPWHFVLPWQVAPMDKGQGEVKVDGAAKPQAESTQANRRQQAKAEFAIAERCLKNGDYAKARTCFEEAHLLAPLSRVGQRAIQRLSDMDTMQTQPVTGAIEEQEAPPARK